ncbi:hypothetical protein [Mesorhizobium sp. B1-1-7]|uniref:hypothetical protein n=1 Tax=Mesorhizobium sp. B1-1-7 TaxID=2589977 RepID=UPI00112CC857|nr:hypothetical protein [Mesorhizobium sp. B1-1-7]TPN49351.1 hypothetical protein FJ978_19330 [Mesorhizobium sp. B1-1-7]
MRSYTPSEIKAAIGTTPDMLRDWRRRGLLENFGVLGSNGKWTYAYGDVIALAIMAFLVTRRIASDLGDALHIARAAVPYVVARLEKSTPSLSRYREVGFLAAWANRDGDTMQIEYFSSIGKFAFAVPGYLVVSFDALVAELTPSLPLRDQE